MANLIRVMSKASKHSPSRPTVHQVELTGVSKSGYSGITVFREITCAGTLNPGTSFQIGDWAEYDSYNLSYTGRIDKITDKCVTITAYPDSPMSRTHRLDLASFCYRNWNFNAAETAARNAETSMYI